MFAKYELEKHLQPDTYQRLDFSDDGPAWSMRLEDGTYRSIFAATPETSCENRKPTFQAVIFHNLGTDGSESWQIATFVSPHPGSCQTPEQQGEEFFGPLGAALESIDPSVIDRELNLRYFAWQDLQKAL